MYSPVLVGLGGLLLSVSIGTERGPHGEWMATGLILTGLVSIFLSQQASAHGKA